jgi:hypothetical protein
MCAHHMPGSDQAAALGCVAWRCQAECRQCHDGLNECPRGFLVCCKCCVAKLLCCGRNSIPCSCSCGAPIAIAQVIGETLWISKAMLQRLHAADSDVSRGMKVCCLEADLNISNMARAAPASVLDDLGQSATKRSATRRCASRRSQSRQRKHLHAPGTQQRTMSFNDQPCLRLLFFSPCQPVLRPFAPT